MSSEFLLEIGTEELPASFVTQALRSLKASALELVGQARLGSGALEVHTLGTPRRLALRIRGLAPRQTDRDETVMGPPWSAAFEADGAPKKAAIGFAKKHGVAVDDLQKQTTEKGDYVSARVHEAGKATAAVLAEILPHVCQRITFPKSMRWGSGEISFGRPIHWVVSLLGSEVVDFEFAGVRAGRGTRGHRFLAPETFDLDEASNYEEALERAHVLVDLEVRKERMMEGLLAAAKALGGVLEPDAFLADECVSLVEQPFTVPGSFDPSFLELPETVVISVMRDHQRYFAVRASEGGALLPAYLNVVNTAQDPETIAKGNDRVLRARLADARFFVEEDRKAPLADRLQKLESVVFQSKLGTMGAKVRRLQANARALAEQSGVDAAACMEAARLCKADLETLIVFEFPELQGEMGRWYALREGMDSAIADAIRDHYRPQGAEDVVPDQVVGAVVAVADRIDTLVGCFGIGLVPTGSADPFALRRAALGIIRIALEGPIDIDLRHLIDQAYRHYAGDADLTPADEVRASLDDFPWSHPRNAQGRARRRCRQRVPRRLGRHLATRLAEPNRSRVRAGRRTRIRGARNRLQARVQHHEGERAGPHRPGASRSRRGERTCGTVRNGARSDPRSNRRTALRCCVEARRQGARRADRSLLRRGVRDGRRHPRPRQSPTIAWRNRGHGQWHCALPPAWDKVATP